MLHLIKINNNWRISGKLFSHKKKAKMKQSRPNLDNHQIFYSKPIRPQKIQIRFNKNSKNKYNRVNSKIDRAKTKLKCQF